MSSTIPSLWPIDLAPAAVRTPLTILKEQAAQLGVATKNLLEGKVTSTSVGQGNDQFLVHWLKIVAPSLNNYVYQLLAVSHPIELYPVDVTFYATNPPSQKKLATEAEFVDHLREAFASDKTRRVIGALLAQVQS